MNSIFKNKKIVAYIALAHHTRFLIPVMEKLENLGAHVMYIVGQAERSQEITAVETGLNYVHVFDYVSDEDQDEIRRNYHSLRDGFVKGLKKEPAVGSTCPLTVIDKILYATAEEHIGFKNFIEKERPDLCLALHELNRWSKMMGFWAKKMNIPVLTLQEGLYNASDYLYIGHVQLAALNLVWGEKTQKKLVGYEAPEEKIIPVGNTHIAQEIINLEKNNTRAMKRHEFNLDDKFIILLLFSAKPPSMEDFPVLFNYLVQNKHLQLILKFHPVTPLPEKEKWTKQMPESAQNAFIFIHSEESTYDLMAMSDLCVLAEPSTTGLEALAIGRPLVQLKLTTPDQYPYNFVKEKVALHLTPGELVKKLEHQFDFPGHFSGPQIKKFIADELFDTTGASDRIITIVGKVIQANTATPVKPFLFKKIPPAKDIVWSIIVPVSENLDSFLAVLESISSFPDSAGRFEVLLVLKGNASNDIQTVLDALEGDVTTIETPETATLTERLNAGALQSKGQRLVFIDENIAFPKNCLESLGTAFESREQPALFGAKVKSIHDNIIHAGIVLDINNAPVSAYKHLDSKFPPAQKGRVFQMLDFFLSLERPFFSELGGFHPRAGRYGFMDLCLTANEKKKQSKAIYLSDIELTRLSSGKKTVIFDDSIHFFSKWHGVLWENEEKLYESDGVSPFQLESARMTRAMDMMKKPSRDLPYKKK